MVQKSGFCILFWFKLKILTIFAFPKTFKGGITHVNHRFKRLRKHRQSFKEVQKEIRKSENLVAVA
jgi:hypothetical protein